MQTLLLTLLLSLFICVHAHASGSIEGPYWTEDRNGIIEVYREGEEVRGRVLWRSSPMLDERNPDPNLRGRSMVGVTFLTGFTPAQDEWRGGSVYSADNGRTYRGKLWLEKEGQILKMRGYVGISLFGRTAAFQRMSDKDSLPEN